MAIVKILRAFACLLVLAFQALPSGGAALASEETSNPPIEVVHSPDSAEDAQATNGNGKGSACGTLEEQAEDVDEGPACHGILTCTFYVGSHILALPFRLLSGLIAIVI